jgi:hypothetical protein
MTAREAGPRHDIIVLGGSAGALKRSCACWHTCQTICLPL